MRVAFVVGVVVASGCLRGSPVEPDSTTTPLTTTDCPVGWFLDADGDGFGDPREVRCPDDADVVDNSLDCDDGDASVSPSQPEICVVGDSLDDDCDPETPDPVAMVGDLPFDTLAEAVQAAATTAETVWVCVDQVVDVQAVPVAVPITISSMDLDPASVELRGVEGPLFELRSDMAALTLKGLTLSGGGGQAGGVVAGGSVVEGLRGTVTLSNVVARNNEAGMGGVVAARSVRVQDSRLEDNAATTFGGAILAEDVVVENSTFGECNADNGGAIFALSQVTSSSSAYDRNEAASKAGAVWSDGDMASTGDRFSNNVALLSGAVEVHGEGSFVNVAFAANEAQRGGALSVMSTSSSPDVSLTLTKSAFEGNVATENAGALLVSGVSTVNAEGARFEGNEVKDPAQANLGSGGAVSLVVNATPMTWAGGTWETNTAGGSGGAIQVVCLGDGDLTFEDVSIGEGQADRGGAVNVATGCQVSFDKGTLTACSADISGGAVMVRSGAEVVFEGTEITSNTAPDGAALFLGADARVTLDDATVSRNTTSRTGAIQLLDSGVYTELVILRSNMGVGGNDNDPADVVMGPVGAAPLWSESFGQNVSRFCSVAGCKSQP